MTDEATTDDDAPLTPEDEALLVALVARKKKASVDMIRAASLAALSPVEALMIGLVTPATLATLEQAMQGAPQTVGDCLRRLYAIIETDGGALLGHIASLRAEPA